MDTLIWSTWGRDWDENDPLAAAGRGLHSRHPGAVLLMHDHVADRPEGHRSHDFAARSTAPLVDGLVGDGWDLVPIGELFNGRPQIRCAWFELR